MFGWFAKKQPAYDFPELSVVDRLIIRELAEAAQARWDAYDAVRKVEGKSEPLVAVARAHLELARERHKRAETAHAEMMLRLTAAAKAALIKSKEA